MGTNRATDRFPVDARHHEGRETMSMKWNCNLAAVRSLLVIGLLAATAGGAGAVMDPAGRQYQNETFGFRLDLSGGLLDHYQSVTSPEGITLASPDGSAVVNIFGSWNEAGKSLAAIVSRYKRELPQARFTYEWHGRDAVVLSGYQAGDIFYSHIAMSPDGRRVAVLNMVYAPELKQQLDPVVTRLSRSLSIR